MKTEGLVENWTTKISAFLVGKTISHIRYMTAQDISALGS